MLCELMNVSRSGYYKWRNRPETEQEAKRARVIPLVKQIHEEHPSHGHRWVAAYIKINYEEIFSENYIYKAFKYLGIKAETKHKVKYKPRKEKDKYPNLIFDVFTKQIIAYKFGEKRGDRMQYIDGLKDVIEILGGEEKQCIIHTDQGSVYASMAYNELIKDKNIVRSMSRAGKPTDNPVNESLNGWIKEELFIDFKLGECRDKESMIEVIERYIKFYNSQRPCYAIGYDTPNNYYEKYINGEIECKDTFSKRNLTEVPKFVQKRMSTFENKKT